MWAGFATVTARPPVAGEGGIDSTGAAGRRYRAGTPVHAAPDCPHGPRLALDPDDDQLVRGGIVDRAEDALGEDARQRATDAHDDYPFTSIRRDGEPQRVLPQPLGVGLQPQRPAGPTRDLRHPGAR